MRLKTLPACAPLPVLRRPDDHRRDVRRPAPCAIAIPKSDQDRHLADRAPRISSLQSRSLSLPAARRTRMAMPSRASPEPSSAPLLALRPRIGTIKELKLAIVLPIDATFSPPLQDRPRRLHPRPANPHRSRPREPFLPAAFLLGRLSDACPSASPPPSQRAPASKTLHQLRRSRQYIRYVRFTSRLRTDTGVAFAQIAAVPGPLPSEIRSLLDALIFAFSVVTPLQ